MLYQIYKIMLYYLDKKMNFNNSVSRIGNQDCIKIDGTTVKDLSRNRIEGFSSSKLPRPT
jgi:hypothetical protein